MFISTVMEVKAGKFQLIPLSKNIIIKLAKGLKNSVLKHLKCSHVSNLQFMFSVELQC